MPENKVIEMKNMPTPLVSIIMPTYNRRRIIGKSIESVLQQTYSNFELIIIDDGSTDNTDEYINSFTDGRIRYIRYKKNKGACHARNRGLKAAKGEYIAFLDSDNIWSKDYLRSRIDKFEMLGIRYGLIWGPIKIYEKNKRPRIFPNKEMQKKLKKIKRKQLIREMIFNNQIDTNSTMLRKECANLVDGFCEELSRLQDWEYFFRIIISTKYGLFFDDRMLVTNFIGDDSIGRAGNTHNFWHARAYFFDKYIDIIHEYLEVYELLFHLLGITYPKLDEQDECGIIELADDIDIVRLINKYQLELKKRDKAYHNLEKIYLKLLKDLEDANNYIGYLNNLHYKEVSIIKFQSKWIECFLNDENVIVKELKKKSISTVAIYGLGWIGKNLYDNLSKSSEIEVMDIIDQKKAGEVYKGIRIKSMEDLNTNVEAVIVTVLGEIKEIASKIDSRLKVISVEELINL